MPEDEIRAKVRRIMEGAYSQGNLDALAGLYAADVLYHRPPLADLEGLKALREYVSDLRRAFSNVRFTVNRIILSEDAFALLWTLQGQHSGRSPALPIPPTGRQATMTGCMYGGSLGRLHDQRGVGLRRLAQPLLATGRHAADGIT